MPHLWVTPEELEDGSGSPFALEACQAATGLLWALSGRKFHGVQTVTERYQCLCAPVLGAGVSTVYPDIVYGQIVNRWLCGRSELDHTRVRLRGRPVQSVSEVLSRGQALTQADYRVVNRSVLEAAPGGILDPWDVTVTYTFGAPPPAAGARAARYLADQLVKSWSGEDCDLPDRVTSVSRQGVSYTILDNQDFLQQGRTGIYSVDLFLKAVNPYNAHRPARVFSPDIPRGRASMTMSTGGMTPVLGITDAVVTPGAAATWSVELTDAQVDMLTGLVWQPRLQVASWNGSTVFEASSSRVSIVGSTLTVALNAADTAALRGSGAAQWDLYAEGVVDSANLLHMINGNIYFSQ